MPRRKKATRPFSNMSISFNPNQKDLTGGLNRMREKLDRIASVAIESDAESEGGFDDFSAALEDTSPLPGATGELLSGDAAQQLADFEAAFNS
jgi:hypothetical protein